MIFKYTYLIYFASTASLSRGKIPHPTNDRFRYILTKVPAVLSSIVIVGTLTRRALLCTMCELKAALRNVQCSLIRKLMLYQFEVGHDIAEETENIYGGKDSSRNFAKRFARPWTVNQCQVGLKPWISWPRSKP